MAALNILTMIRKFGVIQVTAAVFLHTNRPLTCTNWGTDYSNKLYDSKLQIVRYKWRMWIWNTSYWAIQLLLCKAHLLSSSHMVKRAHEGLWENACRHNSAARLTCLQRWLKQECSTPNHNVKDTRVYNIVTTLRYGCLSVCSKESDKL
jgi:hypothetical protein